METTKKKGDALSRDFSFFKENQQALFKEYPGKYLVIRDCAVIDSADTFEDALGKAQSKGLEVGTFLIQHCTGNEDSYTQMFHSRVIFS